MSEEEDATWYKNPKWTSYQLILGEFGCIICVICLCYSIHVLQVQNLPKSIRILNLSGILSFLLCSICHCVNMYYWNTYYNADINIMEMISWYLTAFFWSLGQCLSYIMFESN